MCLCIVYALPLLLSGVLYVDDMNSSLGYYSGINIGRPLVEIFMRLINVSSTQCNLFPYPQNRGSNVTWIFRTSYGRKHYT
jgi:hypothetical protein